MSRIITRSVTFLLISQAFICDHVKGVPPRHAGALANEGIIGVAPPGKAHLLVHKRFWNKFLVESMDMVVQYSIYNIGSKSANNVHLWDSAFQDPSKFEVVGGFPDSNLGVIPPKANVSHNIVVRPVGHGMRNFSSAHISYFSGENVEDLIFGTSNEPGAMFVHSNSAFYRLHSPKLEEWTGYVVMTAPCLLIPYVLWVSSYSKYEINSFWKRKDLRKIR